MSVRYSSFILPLAVLLAGCKNDQGILSQPGTDPLTDDEVACIEVTPSSLDFGELRVGEAMPQTQIVTIRSTCEADLELSGLSLADESAPFTLGTLGTIRLPAGSSTDFTVTFDPRTAASWSTDALVTSNAEGQTTVPVSLSGGGIAPIIEITPPDYDFGNPYIGCQRDQIYTVRNVGTADLFVGSINFVSSSPDFQIELPALPATLAPNTTIGVPVHYLGLDELRDDGFITVSSNDPWSPEVVATASGQSVKYRDAQDIYEQPLKAGTDVLFVVDNSCSMSEEQASLATNFEAFIDTMEAADADYQLAVITTDNPRFRGDIITQDTPDPVGDFQDQALVGINGSGDEVGLDMSYRATQSGADGGPGGEFMRDGATLSIVILSDEDESTISSHSISFYVEYWLGLKDNNPDLVRVNAIAGLYPNTGCGYVAYPAPRYGQAVELTGGQFVSICSEDWGASMEAVALGSISLHHSFGLSEEPVPSTIVVKIDGIVSTSGWTYNPVNNTIIFYADEIPPGGSTIDITYDVLPDCEG